MHQEVIGHGNVERNGTPRILCGKVKIYVICHKIDDGNFRIVFQSSNRKRVGCDELRDPGKLGGIFNFERARNRRVRDIDKRQLLESGEIIAGGDSNR